MTNFQLAECWLLIMLTVSMCNFSEAYRILSVDKSYWECLKGIKLETDGNFTTGNRLISISTIKRCHTRSTSLENSLENEKQSRIKVVFDEDKITLFFKTGKVVLFQKGVENEEKVSTGSRQFSLLNTAAKWVKSKIRPEKTAAAVEDRHWKDRPEEQTLGTASPSKMASLSRTLIEGIIKIFETIWHQVTKTLNNAMKYMSRNKCFVIPAKHFKNAMVSVSLEQCQICGLQIPNLGHITKVMETDFWNITVTHDFKKVTVKLGRLHVQSKLLPPPYSNLDVSGIQFHFDRLVTQTILIIPFKYLIIPSHIRTAVKRLDNFKVNFLTPNPSSSQRMLADSMEQSGLSIVYKIINWALGDLFAFGLFV